MFHFAEGSCFPQAAEENGVQTNGNDLGGDHFLLSKPADGCPSVPAWQGPKTPFPAVPTYVTATHCAGDDSWRLTYDLYFRHVKPPFRSHPIRATGLTHKTQDSGHESDWEFVTLVFKPDPNNPGLYYRTCVIHEQDGKKPCDNYGDFSTFDDPANSQADDQHDGNHVKVYVGKYHHSMHKDINRSNKDDGAVLTRSQFRVDDYAMYSGDNLRDGSVAPKGWAWGATDSAPMKVPDDVCGYSA